MSVQVKDFYVAHRAHTRAWLRSMHPGGLKGRPQLGAHSTRLHQDGQAKPASKNPLSDRGKKASGAKAEALAKVKKEVGGKEELVIRSGGVAALKGVEGTQGADDWLPGPAAGVGPIAGGIKGGAGRQDGHRLLQDRLPADVLEEGPQSAAQLLQPALVWSAADQLSRVADRTGTGTMKADGRGPVADQLPQPVLAAVAAGRTASGPPAERHTAEESRAAGPQPEGALPQEPFQPPQQPRGILIDLNAPPADLDLAETKPGEDPSPSRPLTTPWSGPSPVRSSSGEMAALALGAPARWAQAGAPHRAHPQAAEARGVLALSAPEKRTGAGLARRVQPEATDLRGALAQLVGARDSGPAGEEGPARLARVMRRESSVAGRLQVLEALARGRKRVVQARWGPNLRRLCI